MQVRRQQTAVDWVRKNGGIVTYDWEYYADRSNRRGSKIPGPAWLRSIVGDDYFQQVVHVNITSKRLQDIRPLADLSELRVLWLPGNQIQDISPLAGLQHLEELYIFRNQVKDVSPLSKLSRLRVLSAAENAILDISSLEPLSRFSLIAVDNRPAVQPPNE